MREPADQSRINSWAYLLAYTGQIHCQQLSQHFFITDVCTPPARVDSPKFWQSYTSHHTEGGVVPSFGSHYENQKDRCTKLTYSI